uniref:Uncharacterized protein n=1 Tax=Arundo donax TaxID=35708 RepID=A0A0A9H5J0_ARUDO
MLLIICRNCIGATFRIGANFGLSVLGSYNAKILYLVHNVALNICLRSEMASRPVYVCI